MSGHRHDVSCSFGNPTCPAFMDTTTGRDEHYCEPPPAYAIVFEGEATSVFAEGTPRLRLPGPVGTRWHCDGCPAVYVLAYHPGGRRDSGYVGGGYQWDRETRRQRRQRLGLRWWQR